MKLGLGLRLRPRLLSSVAAVCGLAAQARLMLVRLPAAHPRLSQAMLGNMDMVMGSGSQRLNPPTCLCIRCCPYLLVLPTLSYRLLLPMRMKQKKRR